MTLRYMPGFGHDFETSVRRHCARARNCSRDAPTASMPTASGSPFTAAAHGETKRLLYRMRPWSSIREGPRNRAAASGKDGRSMPSARPCRWPTALGSRTIRRKRMTFRNGLRTRTYGGDVVTRPGMPRMSTSYRIDGGARGLIITRMRALMCQEQGR